MPHQYQCPVTLTFYREVAQETLIALRERQKLLQVEAKEGAPVIKEIATLQLARVNAAMRDMEAALEEHF